MQYDLIIIGGSAAATSAAIYAKRRNLNFLILTKEFGGEVATSGEIGNWPGMLETNGIELTDKFREHLKYYNVEPELGVIVEKITRQEDGTFCITAKKDGVLTQAADKLSGDGDDSLRCDYVSRAVIVTTGVHPRGLNVPGEKEFRNKGVSYCTVCDGPVFPGKVTATIGGGNSALESALMLADIASKVYIINKNPQFKGDQILIDNLKQKRNIEIIYNADTAQILGDEFVRGLKYKDQSGAEKELKVDGIFIHIGMVPNSSLVPDEVKKNSYGEIEINCLSETNVPGFFAAGDVTIVPHKQIVIAAGQGAAAALSAVSYLNKIKQNN